MDPPRVIVFGYDRLMLTSLDALSGAGAEIIAAAFPSVRQDTRTNEIRNEVRARGLETIEQPGKGESQGFAERISDLKPDLIFVWSYPMILPRRVIEIPRLGSINLHMGLLPHYRGVNGLKWALLNDESETGITLHYIDEGIDTGDMISRVSFPIGEDDDLVSLMKKARFAGMHLIKNIWPQLVNGKIKAMPQDEADAGYYSAAMEPPREVDWSRPAHEIHNLIRASPKPFDGVYTKWQDKKIVLRRSRPDESRSGTVPALVAAVDTAGIRVATGSGSLLISEVEIDGQLLSRSEIAAVGMKAGDALGVPGSALS
ncbi:MAG TPA: methionyl-tRNA formyltransferase [Pyrinomonadaceae bacterium]|nr:methionyl-tRNA formyltransferase [Pyrinomonadaceae bacterium]